MRASSTWKKHFEGKHAREKTITNVASMKQTITIPVGEGKEKENISKKLVPTNHNEQHYVIGSEDPDNEYLSLLWVSLNNVHGYSSTDPFIMASNANRDDL
ncbi:hypothetical protein V6N13_022931 [Hibiscus sabdariffa]|uniref:Uncharacterized protein n=2 Tax=Hibiscus sabdariffa TaxID=183260 RepID=A0ABR2A998_9ROSI